MKWAGGKRWLLSRSEFEIPNFEGRYIEPFVGGGAVFFHVAPRTGTLADANPRLIAAYAALKDNWSAVYSHLKKYVKLHSAEFYYEERSKSRRSKYSRAAQFIYLNRTCFNGLYRENLKGQFNVPIGIKTQVLRPDDDFRAIAHALHNIDLRCQDFEETLASATSGDFIFVDPPYTVAHNANGFIEYNQKIFDWGDQVRLKGCVANALERGATVFLTNANHESIIELYADLGTPLVMPRNSKISGKLTGRGQSTEVLYRLGVRKRSRFE